jgi:hypothetical protein
MKKLQRIHQQVMLFVRKVIVYSVIKKKRLTLDIIYM